jgi:hypothetical protein
LLPGILGLESVSMHRKPVDNQVISWQKLIDRIKSRGSPEERPELAKAYSLRSFLSENRPFRKVWNYAILLQETPEKNQ